MIGKITKAHISLDITIIDIFYSNSGIGKTKKSSIDYKLLISNKVY